MQTDDLSATPHNNENKLVGDAGSSTPLLRTRQFTRGETFSIVTSCYSGRRRKSIIGPSELQFSDGLYAEEMF
jgi:hypothetical protein